MSRAEKLAQLKEYFLKNHVEDYIDGTGFDLNVMDILSDLEQHYIQYPEGNKISFRLIPRNYDDLKLTWRDREGVSQLLTRPAAKLLALIWVHKGKWRIECLGKEIIFDAGDLKEAKQKALQWFLGTLGDIAVATKTIG